MRITPDFFQNQNNTRFAWLGMAGLIVNAGGTIILIDPLLCAKEEGGRFYSESGPPLAIPLPLPVDQVKQVDAVFYTHADHDHFTPATPLALNSFSPGKIKFFGPPPVIQALSVSGIPDGQLKAVRADQEILIRESGKNACTIQVSPARHDWQEVNPWGPEDCCGYIIKTPEATLWHPGDTKLIDPLLEINGIDVLFFDIANVDGHMSLEESARLAANCGARVIIPIHFGLFDLPPGGYATGDPLSALPFVKDLSADYRILEPGKVSGGLGIRTNAGKY